MSGYANRRRQPRVVVHLAVSLDGATSGFEIDVDAYYSTAATWTEDVTLTGADTILQQEEALAASAQPGPSPDRPLLAVVDSRERVTSWDGLRNCGFWSGVIAIRTRSSDVDGLEEIVTGGERADLQLAVEELARRHSARVIRVDSGGQLVEAMLEAGIVDELSLLVHPVIAGRTATSRWLSYDASPVSFSLVSVERRDAGLVWLRFEAMQG